MDRETLIVADTTGSQLLKYTIDRVTRTCTGQVWVDTGFNVRSIACSEDGLVFATQLTGSVVNVQVFNVNTGHREVWDTNINSESGVVHITRSDDFIVVTAGNVSYVHNTNRVLLYSLTHEEVSQNFLWTYISDTGMFWGTVVGGYKLLTMDLLTKETKIITEGIVRAHSVSGTRNENVYVTDTNHADVGVYSADGTFLGELHIDRPEQGGSLWYFSGTTLSHTEDLIAFCAWDEATPITVYRTHR